jgi:hypothetical protein
MGLNPNAISKNMKCRNWTSEVTADEIFAAKVKLIGAVILILADALVLTLIGFPNLPPP